MRFAWYLSKALCAIYQMRLAEWKWRIGGRIDDAKEYEHQRAMVEHYLAKMEGYQ